MQNLYIPLKQLIHEFFTTRPGMAKWWRAWAHSHVAWVQSQHYSVVHHRSLRIKTSCHNCLWGRIYSYPPPPPWVPSFWQARDIGAIIIIVKVQYSVSIWISDRSWVLRFKNPSKSICHSYYLLIFHVPWIIIIDRLSILPD